VKYSELLSALGKLSEESRDALLLIVAEGMSYEEAAEIAGVPVGTLKSRVNRARERLAELIDIDLPKANQRAAARAAGLRPSAPRPRWEPTADAA
jgi:RNA polymerase sigma-70 factor (ECF subfamily)